MRILPRRPLAGRSSRSIGPSIAWSASWSPSPETPRSSRSPWAAWDRTIPTSHPWSSCRSSCTAMRSVSPCSLCRRCGRRRRTAFRSWTGKTAGPWRIGRGYRSRRLNRTPPFPESFSRLRGACRGRSRPCSRGFDPPRAGAARAHRPLGRASSGSRPSATDITGRECRPSRCPLSTTAASASTSRDANGTASSLRHATKRPVESSSRCCANAATRAPESPWSIPSSARRPEIPWP